ncbi:hypothetical protein ANCDUO_19686 [Ancylostoma duodenale]|uniref:Uncharacterized protein n=1 Tax=Ancylostoma duodenale TaxID=51022 RepID=A0A0C2FZH0_9BILA|nr:hypothetical protein ANCDUO_19686 [Ancylostoma duodenale]
MEEDHYDTPWEFLARPNSVRLSAIDAALFAKGPSVSAESPQRVVKRWQRPDCVDRVLGSLTPQSDRPIPQGRPKNEYGLDQCPQGGQKSGVYPESFENPQRCLGTLGSEKDLLEDVGPLFPQGIKYQKNTRRLKSSEN